MKRIKKEEQVLLYQFHEEAVLEQLQAVLKKLHIRATVLQDEDYAQKIGFLLGMKGFQPAKQRAEAFRFPEEVMVLHNIQGKRLDEVLRAMSEANIPKIRYKAVVTPFNILWTLQRLCETMQREHAAVLQQKEAEQKGPDEEVLD